MKSWYPLSLIAVGCTFSARAQTAPTPPAEAGATDAPAQTITLNPFTVSGEQSKGYGSTTVSSATRMNTSLQDIPQTVSVINDQFLKDLGTSSLDMDTALSYAPGVKFQSWSSGQVYIRGFQSFVNFEDGVRLPDAGGATSGGGASFVPDFVAIDHVEIVKGPASAIEGRGTAGGLLNFVTKHPVIGPTDGTATVTVGSDSYKDAQIDANATVSGTMAVHVDVDALDSSYWRQNTSDIHNFAVYPSFLWRPTQNTDVLVQVQYHQSTQPSDFGMAYDTINKRWPSFSYSNSEQYANRTNTLYGATINISHAFNRYVSVRQIVSAAQAEDNEHMVWPLSINAAVAGNADGYPVNEIYFTRQLQNNNFKVHNFVAQGDLLVSFSDEKLLISTQTLFSYEYSANRVENFQSNESMSDIDWDTPVYGTPATNPVAINYQLTKRSLYGLLVSEQLGFFHDRVLVSAGIRRDGVGETTILNQFNNTSTTSPSASITHPRIGVVFKVTPDISVYGIYSKNAQPEATVFHFPNLPFNDPRNSSITVNQNGDLKEAGIKTSLFNHALTLTAAVYRLESFGGTFTTAFGPAQNDPATAGQLETVITPADRSQGIELEAMGNLFTPRLSVIGAFQELATHRFISGAFEQFRGVPHWTGSLFANYDFRMNPRASGFQAHAGVIVQGVQQGDNGNTFLIHSQPHFDTGVSYSYKNVELSLNVLNLTNAIVPTQFNAYRANSVLPPREIRFSTSYKF